MLPRDGISHVCCSELAWLLIRFCFFFSSRRRHTRSLCDWSSDVCSSDLAYEPRLYQKPVGGWPPNGSRLSCGRPARRSEERRVGKECRSRWSRGGSKEKRRGSRSCGSPSA